VTTIALSKMKNKNDGFTLIESLCALFILVILFSLSAPVYLNARLKIIRHQQIEDALIVVERVLITLETKDIATIPLSGIANETIVQSGRTYSTKITYCPVPTSANDIQCDSSAPKFRAVRVAVNRGDQEVFSIVSGFSQPN
jgi:prepilin-type N-terminal cleavage/methylation domain-containing protein